MVKNTMINKVISICTLLILFSVVVFSYKQYDEYKNSEKQYTEVMDSMTNQMNIFIKGILSENIRKAELHLGQNTNMIHKKLLVEYGDDLNGLEEDINNPSVTSILNNILDEFLIDIYINEDSNDNRPFAMSMNNILWSRSMHIPPENLNIDEFKSIHYNSELAEQSLNAIKNLNIQKNDFIFWEFTPSAITNHKMISNMNINDMIDVYHTEGIDSLKSYELLVPMYITKNGDIFGTKDINSLGEKIENYKIIIIQRINVYDALSYHQSDLNYYYSQIDKVQAILNTSNSHKASLLIQSVLFIILILIGSSIIQNKVYSK